MLLLLELMSYFLLFLFFLTRKNEVCTVLSVHLQGLAVDVKTQLAHVMKRKEEQSAIEEKKSRKLVNARFFVFFFPLPLLLQRVKEENCMDEGEKKTGKDRVTISIVL